MAVGVRTQDLRKVYSTAPPSGAAGMFIARADAKIGKQPKAQIPALDGLALDILPGEIFGLLGPNGAGKSTTIGVLTTRVRPTSGQAWIGEHDVWKEQTRVKRQASDWCCAPAPQPRFFFDCQRDSYLSCGLLRS